VEDLVKRAFVGGDDQPLEGVSVALELGRGLVKSRKSYLPSAVLARSLPAAARLASTSAGGVRSHLVMCAAVGCVRRRARAAGLHGHA